MNVRSAITRRKWSDIYSDTIEYPSHSGGHLIWQETAMLFQSFPGHSGYATGWSRSTEL